MEGNAETGNQVDPEITDIHKKVAKGAVKALDTAAEGARDVTEAVGGGLKQVATNVVKNVVAVQEESLEELRANIPTDVPEDFERMIAFLTALPPTGILTAGERVSEEHILEILEAAKPLLKQRASSGVAQNTRAQTDLAIVEDMLGEGPESGAEPMKFKEVALAAGSMLASHTQEPFAGLVMGGTDVTDVDVTASADAAAKRSFATDDGKPRTKNNKYVETISEVAENMFNQRPGPTWRGTVKCNSTAGKKLRAHKGDGERAYACHPKSGRVFISSKTSGGPKGDSGFTVYAQGETEKVAHYDGDVEAVTGKQWSVHSFANQASTYVVRDSYKDVRAKAGLSRTPSTWGWAENHATVKDKNHPDLIAKSLETGMKATGTTERVGKITEKGVHDTGYTKFVDDDLVSHTVLAITVNTIEKQAIFSAEANDLIVGWKLAGKFPKRTALFTGKQKKLLAAYEDEKHGLQITPVDNKTIKVRIPFLGDDEKIAGSDTYSVIWGGGNDVTWTKDNAEASQAQEAA